MRPYTYFRDVRAHCESCGAEWCTPNAQGVAARHYDATGHRVSVEIQMHITYGGVKTKPKAKARSRV